MIQELTKPPRLTQGVIKRIRKVINYLKDKIPADAEILDIGQENHLTKALSAVLRKSVDNTTGDLDSCFVMPKDGYDIIIYSHTIEHQFSPLHTLGILKLHLYENGRMYIFAPNGCTFKFLWGKGHYHEIDQYRMGLLLKRAGLKLISTTKQRYFDAWWHYLLGVRPFLRLVVTLIDCNTIIYEVSK